MKNKYFKKSVKKIWLISYISIFIIPIMFFGLVYYETYVAFRNEIIRYNVESIKASYISINDSIYNMFEVQTKSNISTRINGVSKAGEIDETVRFNLYEISKDLYQMNSGIAFNTFIYFPGIDSVVSSQSITGINSFYDKYFSQVVDKDGFDDYLHGIKSTGLYIKKENNGNIFFASKLTNDCTIFFMMYNNYITNVVNKNFLTENGTLYILDVDNYQLFPGNDDSLEELTPLLNSDKDLISQVKFKGVKSTAILIKSNSLNYLFLIPEKLYFEKLFNVNITLFTSIFFTTALGILSIVFIIRTNYKPIKKIMESFGTPSPATDEYTMISNIMNSMSEKAKELEDILSKSQTVIKDSIAVSLLNGKAPPSGEMIDKRGFNLNNRYIVVAVNVQDYGTLTIEGETDDIRDTAHLIISNILMELIEKEYKCLITEMDDNVTCIIEEENETDNFESNVYDIVGNAQTQAMQKFLISFFAGIGQAHKGYNEIINSYRQAVDALEYKFMIETDNIIKFSNINRKEGYNYYYSQDKEQQFSNIIRSGDYNAAERYLLDIIEEYTKDENVSANLIKCSLFDLMGTILKTSALVAGEDIFINDSTVIDAVFNSNKISDIASNLKNILKVVCDDIEKQNITSNKQEDLKNYIDNHYTENSLNISAVGEYFGFAPSYISKLFKDSYNESMLDYINRLRIEKAQELLIATDKNIDDIAKEVGISNKVTFIRVFKKFTSLTPSAFREISK